MDLKNVQETEMAFEGQPNSVSLRLWKNKCKQKTVLFEE